MTRSARRGPWLPEEDQALLQLVRSQGPNNWVRISQQLQHRSPKQCRERYHQNLKPSLKHDPITTQEGEAIEQMVLEMGKRWAEIARRLGNRSDNAVKNWWNGSMNRRSRNPAQSLNGFKQVGSRLNPMRFTVEPGTVHAAHPQRSPDLHRVSNLRPTWSHPATRPPHNSQSAGGNNLATIAHPPAARDISDVFRSERPHRSEPPLAPTDRPQSARPQLSRSNTSDNRRELPPLQPLSFPTLSGETRMGALERPLVSPACSDASQRQPPSLISDSHSTYSVSPKTVPSPRVYQRDPKDVGLQSWWDTKHGGPLHPLRSVERRQPTPIDSPRSYQQESPDMAGPGQYSSRGYGSRDLRMHLSTLLG